MIFSEEQTCKDTAAVYGCRIGIKNARRMFEPMTVAPRDKLSSFCFALQIYDKEVTYAKKISSCVTLYNRTIAIFNQIQKRVGSSSSLEALILASAFSALNLSALASFSRWMASFSALSCSSSAALASSCLVSVVLK